MLQLLAMRLFKHRLTPKLVQLLGLNKASAKQSRQQSCLYWVPTQVQTHLWLVLASILWVSAKAARPQQQHLHALDNAATEGTIHEDL
jgi:hypothetical protein